MRKLSELGDIIGPLIQAEELIKNNIAISSQYKVRYDQLRLHINEKYGIDMVDDIANSEVFDGLTVAQHARSVIMAYIERLGNDESGLLEEIKNETIAASERAYVLYIK